MSKNRLKRRNKRRQRSVLLWVVLGGALLLVAAIIFYPRDGSDPDFVPLVSGAPSLEVDKEQIDFGDVRFNEFVTASFELTNVGDKDLRFTAQPYVELKAGC